MQKMFLLPVLAAAVLTGCGSAPKHMASSCDTAAASHVVDGGSNVVLAGAGDMLTSGYMKSAAKSADCGNIKVSSKSSDGTAAEGAVRLDARVLFGFDSAMLTDGGKVELDLLINDINALELVSQIMVIGHTDSIGSKSYNQMLSERRAHSVRDYLSAKLAEMEIHAEGRGELEPIADNATAEGRAKNRRVEVIVDGTMEAKSRFSAGPVMDKMSAAISKLTGKYK